MALNIKNTRTESLAAEVAHLAGETKTQAITTALDARRKQLLMQRVMPDRAERLRRFMATEIWPSVPPDLVGEAMTKAETEAVLGLDEDGV
jgi:antitoxin VapB